MIWNDIGEASEIVVGKCVVLGAEGMIDDVGRSSLPTVDKNRHMMVDDHGDLGLRKVGKISSSAPLILFTKDSLGPSSMTILDRVFASSVMSEMNPVK